MYFFCVRPCEKLEDGADVFAKSLVKVKLSVLWKVAEIFSNRSANNPVSAGELGTKLGIPAAKPAGGHCRGMSPPSRFLLYIKKKRKN